MLHDGGLESIGKSYRAQKVVFVASMGLVEFLFFALVGCKLRELYLSQAPAFSACQHSTARRRISWIMKLMVLVYDDYDH